MSKCLGRDISVRQHSKSEHWAPCHIQTPSRYDWKRLKATLSPNQTNKQTKIHNRPVASDLSLTGFLLVILDRFCTAKLKIRNIIRQTIFMLNIKPLNLYHSLGKFSRQQIDDFFFIFLTQLNLLGKNFSRGQKNWWYFSYFSQKIAFDISCKLSRKRCA